MADPSQFYLFDTFSGISDARLGPEERDLAGQYPDTSPEYVAGKLKTWKDQVTLVPGDVFDTVPYPTGPLAFVHMDLNAAEATGHCLEFAYRQLVPGGIIVFDDYGCETYAAQRTLLDAALFEFRANTIALPTGQAVVIKHG